MITPLGVGLLLFLVVVAFVELLRIADAATGVGIGPGQFFVAFVYSLPPLLGLLLPVSGLFATLIAFGRMGSDGEIVGLSAAGVGPWSLLLMPLAVGMVLMLLSALALVVGEPWGLGGLRRVLASGAQSALIEGLEPGRFHHWVDGVTFMVRAKDDDGRLRGLVIIDERESDRPLVISAKTGRLTSSSADKEIFFDLNEGQILKYASDSHVAQTIQFDEGSYRLNVAHLVGDTLLHVTKAQGMTFTELLAAQDDASRKPKGRAVALVTLNRKLALPIAAVIFALLAVPLAGGSLRGGRARALAYSCAIVGGYYYIGRAAEMWARGGSFSPALAPWIPNLLGIALFFWFMHRHSKAVT